MEKGLEALQTIAPRSSRHSRLSNASIGSGDGEKTLTPRSPEETWDSGIGVEKDHHVLVEA